MLSTIFSLSVSWSRANPSFSHVHMFGQTTRKLVEIALLILYQTNLRTQKFNDHLIIYLITDYGINQYVAEIALFYTIKDLLYPPLVLT